MKIFSEIDRRLIDTFGQIKVHIRILSWMGIILIPFSYIVEYQISPEFDPLPIRMATALLLLPTTSSTFLSLPNRFVAFWSLLMIWWTLSCMFCLFLIANALQTPVDKTLHALWIAEFLTGAFLFTNIVRNPVLVAIGWGLTFITLSTIFSVGQIVITTTQNINQVIDIIPYMVAAIVSAALLQFWNTQNLRTLNTASYHAVYHSTNSFGEEILLALDSIEKKIATASNQLDRELSGDIAQALPRKQFQLLKSTGNQMMGDTKHAASTIEALLATTKSSPSTGTNKTNKTNKTNNYRPILFELATTKTTDAYLRIEMKGFPLLSIDGVLFKNLIKNLIQNAEKQLLGKSNKLIVITWSTNPLEIRVWDNGPGIPNRIKQRIFEEFFTTSDAESGIGIGLSYCKSVMESIGGNIRCESIPGVYTEFICEFPKEN